MMLYLIGGLAAATLIAGGVASCEHKQKVAARAETQAVQARFDGFVLEAKRLGDEQTAKAAKKEADDRANLEQQRKSYEARLSRLQSERNAAQRVLDRYASADRGKMPGVPEPAEPPGPGSADLVARAALEQLARESQETTLMFLECRDSWKAVAAR